MKKILILIFIFIMICQTAQAKAIRIGEVWVFDSRHWWQRTVEVNPDRKGAAFIHEYMNELSNIYDSVDSAKKRLTHRKELYINMGSYELGHIYFRVAKYDITMAKIAGSRGEDYKQFIWFYLARLETMDNYARANLKVLSNNKIKVLPQTIDNRKWIIADVLINQDSFVFEYVPEEKVSRGRSNEVFSIEFVNKNFAKDLVEYKDKFQMYNKLYKDDLELNYEEKELSKSDNGFTWYYGFGDKNENVVMAVKQVEDGYFRVAYLKYNSMSKEEIDKFKQITEERIKALE